MHCFEASCHRNQEIRKFIVSHFCSVISTNSVCLSNVSQRSDRLIAPPEGVLGQKDSRYKVLDQDGLPLPGEFIDPGDIYLLKETPLDTSENLKAPEHMTDKGRQF